MGISLSQVLIGGTIAGLLLIFISFMYDYPRYDEHIEKPELPLSPQNQVHYMTANIGLDYFRKQYERTDSLLLLMEKEQQLKLSESERYFLAEIRNYQHTFQKFLDDFLDHLSKELEAIYRDAGYQPENPVAGIPFDSEKVGHILFYYRRELSFLDEASWFNKSLYDLVQKQEQINAFKYPGYPPAPAFFDYISLSSFPKDRQDKNNYLLPNYFIGCTLIEGIALLNLIHHQTYYRLYRLQRYFAIHHISPYQAQLNPRLMTLDLSENGVVQKQQLYNLMPLETEASLKVKWEQENWKVLSLEAPHSIPLKAGARLEIKLQDSYFQADTRLRQSADQKWTRE